MADVHHCPTLREHAAVAGKKSVHGGEQRGRATREACHFVAACRGVGVPWARTVLDDPPRAVVRGLRRSDGRERVRARGHR
eukprot:scaffold105620_cov38-Tisochrysis_lutea.AAC.2